LEELIRILHHGDQSGINSGLMDNEYLIKMMEYLSSEDSEEIARIIGWLEDDSNRNEIEYVDLRPSILIMIAYASCKLEDQQQTLYYAKFATEQFPKYQNLWNEALAFWFLGMVYRNNGYIEESESALKNAEELLKEHTQTLRKYNNTSRDLCFEYIRRIEQEIRNLPAYTYSSSPPRNKEARDHPGWGVNKSRQPSSSEMAGFDSTPMTTNGFTIDSVHLSPIKHSNKTPARKKMEGGSPNSILPPIGSPPFHIVIPVDIQALMYPQDGSRPLTANLYEQLREYNRRKANRISTNEDEQAKNHQLAYNPHPFNQWFPIYGKATAGPKGEVTFEVPEVTNGVTEDNEVEFFGIKHNIYSSKEKDSQIKISNTKTYGWLMIVGESMNIASPIPIDNQDYVLFYKINDLDSCINKIVIATKPELDEQYPTLVVKRLIATIPNSKKWGDGKKKYYLHSESSWDEYKDNIEFTEKNQLIGEVIAVAKRVK